MGQLPQGSGVAILLEGQALRACPCVQVQMMAQCDFGRWPLLHGMRTVPMDGVVKSVAWNPHSHHLPGGRGSVREAQGARGRVGDRPMPEDLHLTLTVGRTRCCC